eukprot:Skav235882  [mRNA]  locus=scaffold1192:103266:107666:- [translate_table: standard]
MRLQKDRAVPVLNKDMSQRFCIGERVLLSEGSVRNPPETQAVPRKQPNFLCCGNICGAFHLLRTRKEGVETDAWLINCSETGNSSAQSSTAPQLPIARCIQEDRRTERQHRAAELRKRFQIARETAKATEGPVIGVRPGAFNMLARARWDSWAKLKRMDKEVAKQGYCALIDKFSPGGAEQRSHGTVERAGEYEFVEEDADGADGDGSETEPLSS